MIDNWEMPTQASSDRDLLLALKALITPLELEAGEEFHVVVSPMPLSPGGPVPPKDKFGTFRVKMPPDNARAIAYREILIALPLSAEPVPETQPAPEAKWRQELALSLGRAIEALIHNEK